MSLEVGRLRHLLLGAHGAAVLCWRTTAEVLLLQEPLVDVLVEHALGRLRQRGPAASSATLLLLPLPWSSLSGLERRPSWSSGASARPSVLPLEPAH